MVKHTQSVFDHFWGLAFKGLTLEVKFGHSVDVLTWDTFPDIFMFFLLTLNKFSKKKDRKNYITSFTV